MFNFALGFLVAIFIPYTWSRLIKGYILNGFTWVQRRWEIDDSTGDVVEAQTKKVVLKNE